MEHEERLKVALADRYQIEGEIGTGGMATVYLAKDVKHHRKVAVKVLRPDRAASLGVERFGREIGIAANLTHPHILPPFDSGEADGFLYYVMPFIEGESLRDRLAREQKLSAPDAVGITHQVASASSHAHERGLVHRDIKPENILLAGDQAAGDKPSTAAAASATVGDLDEALYWLSRAIEMGFINHRFFAENDPFLAKVRWDPRFEALMGRAREKEREIEAEA